MGQPFTFLFAAASKAALIITIIYRIRPILLRNFTIINKVRFIAVLAGIMLLISVGVPNIFPIRFSNYMLRRLHGLRVT
jgi:hypothetical protein